MVVDGKNLISTATRISWRSVILYSSGILTIAIFDLNGEAWNFLDRSIDPSDFKIIATALILFVTVSHIVNWWSDLSAFANWKPDLGISDITIDETSYPEKQNKFVRVVELLKTIKADQAKLHPDLVQGKVSDKLAKELIEKLNRFQKSSDELIQSLNAVDVRVRDVNRTGAILISIWFLIIPLLLSIVSICLIWN